MVSDTEESPLVSSEEDNEVVEDVQACPSCSEPVSQNAKFCAECGHKMTAEAKEEKNPVVETKEPVIEEDEEDDGDEELEASALDNRAFDSWLPEKEEKEDENKEAEEFTYEGINPETEWQCFGQIEPDHVECKGCQFRERCAVKSGVEL